jgi:hypothetical protein
MKDGRLHFDVEPERVKNVLLKLARGHAAYELSRLCPEEPAYFAWCSLEEMEENEKEAFEACHVTHMFGEVGSRATQRIQVLEVKLQSTIGEQRSQGLLLQDWLEVQEGRYRFLAVDDSRGIIVRMVISEFLACEVIWRS